MTYFNMDSFGADCPVNWEEIADYLNAVLTARLGDDFDDEDPDTIEAADSVWESYCYGDFPDAPKPAELTRVYRAAEEDGRDGIEKLTFSEDEARTIARLWYNHLTPKERTENTVSVSSWEIPVYPGQTAEEAFRDWSIKEFVLPDPDTYEEIEEDPEAAPLPWYAFQTDTTDAWDNGTYIRDKALDWLRHHPDGLLAVIENDVCTEEIRFDDIAE